METSEIYASLKTNTLTRECVGGVVALDLLPRKEHIKYNEHGITFFIVNLDTSDKPGSHWVAILISPVREIYNEYFDSYGLKPPTEIADYLDNNYIMQSKCLQSFQSTICGQWCIFYVWHRCRGYTLSDITSKFRGKTLSENDVFINRIINDEFIGEHEPILDENFISSQISRKK